MATTPRTAVPGPLRPVSQQPPPASGQHAPTEDSVVVDLRHSKPDGHELESVGLQVSEHRLPSCALTAQSAESQSLAELHTEPMPVGANGSAMQLWAKHIRCDGQSWLARQPTASGTCIAMKLSSASIRVSAP
jgi:hypothetical protein